LKLFLSKVLAISGNSKDFSFFQIKHLKTSSMVPQIFSTSNLIFLASYNPVQYFTALGQPFLGEKFVYIIHYVLIPIYLLKATKMTS
jgi:hypothetical protein